MGSSTSPFDMRIGLVPTIQPHSERMTVGSLQVRPPSSEVLSRMEACSQPCPSMTT